jgi:hypothetical protein
MPNPVLRSHEAGEYRDRGSRVEAASGTIGARREGFSGRAFSARAAALDKERIMKTIWPVILVGAGVLSGLCFSQGPQVDANAQRLDRLEADMVETQALLAQTLKYLDQQSKSASSMAATLDQAEAAGFTAGINYESRKILVKGWRDQLSALQKDLPTPPVSPVAAGTKPASDKGVKPK